MEDGIVGRYLRETQAWREKLGKTSMVFLQVGSFYELYALLGEDDVYEGGDVTAFSRINHTRVVAKGAAKDGRRVMMAGVNITHVETHIQRMVDNGFTVVVISQDYDGPGAPRNLERIISPGTTLAGGEDRDSNTLYCAWVRKCGGGGLAPGARVLAAAALNVHTGETNVLQVQCENRHDPAIYDELERHLAIHDPSECIIIHNLGDEGSELAPFIGYTGAKLHLISEGQDGELGGRAANAAKQTYQDLALDKYYAEPAAIVTDMEREHDLALQALVFLLDFAHMHHPGLTERLSPPCVSTRPGRLIMGNHSLAQLNVIGDRRHRGRLASVRDLLNQCVTSMGRRRFGSLLANPITSHDKLSQAYEATDIVQRAGVGDTYKGVLQEVMDIQKIMRKQALRRLAPRDVVGLFQSVGALLRLSQFPRPDGLPEGVLDSAGATQHAGRVLDHINAEFNIETLSLLDSLGGEELARAGAENLALARAGKCPKLDELVALCTQGHDLLKAVADALGNEIAKTEKGGSRKGPYVRVHETAKLPPTLTATARRMHNLKARLKGIDTLSVSGVQLCVNSLEYTKQTGSRHVITSPQIRSMAKGSQESHEQLIACVRQFWKDAMERLGSKDLIASLQALSNFAAEADVLQCRAHVAKKYNYCRPQLVESERAFFDARGIRHPLIEHLSEKEVYVTNDVALGEGDRGMLLYGTNAVGKTSLIRATGLAVVMAQAGMHVPCSSFRFSPYDAIYTRILGNDNLFKGLSTFNVEMAELRVILKGANENSLILGDEVCSGTETGSATSIFATCLESLHAARSTFMFATHMHEVTRFPEVDALDGLQIKHLQVKYDASRDTLLYDRKLKDGPGEARYGLEVCKALGLPDAFLERAHELRRKYAKADTSSVSGSILDLPTSRYSSKKVRGDCEKCGKAKATQVHHLQHQASADAETGYIGCFHKNHPANLLGVCDACHDAFHETDVEHRKMLDAVGHGFELAEVDRAAR